MKIWIVLPAYNEEEALPPLIAALVEEFQEEKRQFKILIINDGSEDGTRDVAEAWSRIAPVTVHNNEANKGLAETLRIGLLEALKLAAKDDIIITMDADNTHPAALAMRMVRLIREGNDVVIASRYRAGSYVRGLPRYRRLLSYGASWLFRLLFPIRGVRDYTSGYRAYRAAILSQLMSRFGEAFISEKGFTAMVDILLRLREQQLIFTEVPLILRYDLKPGRSKMNVRRTIRETLSLAVRRRLFPNLINHGKRPLGSPDGLPVGRSYYTNNYVDYQKQNPPHKIGFYVDLLERWVGKGQPIFELGVGLGLFLERVSEKFDCQGCDINRYAIETTRKKLPHVPLFLGSYEHIPTKPPPKAVVSWDTLEHLPDLDRGLDSIFSKLPEWGCLIAVVPVYDGPLGWLVHLLDRDPTHVTKISRREWLSRLKRHGFDVAEHGGIFRRLIGSRYLHFVRPQTILKSCGNALYFVGRKPPPRCPIPPDTSETVTPSRPYARKGFAT